jgi:hypothetical protein
MDVDKVYDLPFLLKQGRWCVSPGRITKVFGYLVHEVDGRGGPWRASALMGKGVRFTTIQYAAMVITFYLNLNNSVQFKRSSVKINTQSDSAYDHSFEF